MSKKSDQYYFDNFIACTNSACQAARMLEENLNDFHVETLMEKLDDLQVFLFGLCRFQLPKLLLQLRDLALGFLNVLFNTVKFICHN